MLLFLICLKFELRNKSQDFTMDYYNGIKILLLFYVQNSLKIEHIVVQFM